MMLSLWVPEQISSLTNKLFSTFPPSHSYGCFLVSSARFLLYARGRSFILTSQVIQMPELRNKYPLRDQYRQLKGRKCKLIVRYRRMPIMGVMDTANVEKQGEFAMPDKYFRE